MTDVAVALCREGFEAEAVADLAAIADHARLSIEPTVRPGSAYVVARFASFDDAAWRRAARAHPATFARSLWTGSGPHAIVADAPHPSTGGARPDRILPLASAFAGLAASSGHGPPWLAPWIEYADTNEGKALSTLARALEARLAAALRERGLVADGAGSREHVILPPTENPYIHTTYPA